MKKIIFIFCCFITLSAYSQSVEDNPEVRNWLDNMFQHLDKSKVPYGYLRDYAFELADLDIYNGKELNDSNYVNRTAFENLLRTMRSASVGTKPYNVDEILSAQYALDKENAGIMGVLIYQYSYIREDALSKNLIRYENEQVYDNTVNGVWQNPYATGYTLGFSAQDTTLYGSRIDYSFPSAIWKSNVSVKFEWNTKTETGTTAEWIRHDEWRVPTFDDKVFKVTVYMRIVNAEGMTSNTMYFPLDATAPYCFESGSPQKIYKVYYPSPIRELRIDPNFLVLM